MYDFLGLGPRKIPFWEVIMKAVSTFPETVEYKSCTATIYRHKHLES